MAALAAAVVAVPVTMSALPAGAAASNIAPFRSADALVRQQYRDFQGRTPTSSEVAPHLTGLADGSKSAADVVDGIAHLGEPPARSGNVTRLYTAYFQRVPDISGLEYWVGKSAAGWTLNKISGNFAGSSEFTRRYGSLSNAGFVDRAFENVFGRAADPGGRAYWINKLNKGTSRGVVMVGFSQSSEYQRKQAPTVDMVLAYRGLLHRIPTGTEAADATALVQADGFEALAEVLLGLPAYATRFPAPGVPTAFTARVGDAKATLAWKAPATNGVAIAGYTLRVLKGGVQQGADRPLAASALSAVVTGLTNGQAYSFSLVAFNVNRDGAAASVGPVTVKAEVVWSTFQGNASHTGVQPNGTVPASPALKWKKKFPGMVRQLTVGDGRIYALVWAVPEGQTSQALSLVALDPSNGAVLWGPREISSAVDVAGMTYDEGRIFVASNDDRIRAYSSATGSLAWSAQPGGLIIGDRGPAVYGGRVYSWGEDGLLALDAANGAIRWRGAQPVGGWAPPAVDATGIYLSDGCPRRITLSGQPSWKKTSCQGGDAWVTLASGRMWVTDTAEEYATILDQATGAAKGSPLGTEPPAVTGPTALYDVDDLGDVTLRAVDWATGELKWSKGGDGYFQGSPVVNAGRTYISSWLGKVYGFDVATGGSTWTRDIIVDITDPGEEPDYTAGKVGDLAIGDGLLLVPLSDESFDEGGWILAYG
ncbi:MAG: hypothetical protein JWO77_3099 [Ilumatobacteraceae bacterium]|nr:hypothetical protein [Ilumatobacteraceae bacterium]